MAESPEYRELLQLLNEFEVDYLIVGGFAVMKYGEPRYTKDLDVWIHNSLPNCIRVIGALKKFGAPLDNDGITAETFSGKQVVYQIGIAPVRIDILTAITGVEFADAWKNKVRSRAACAEADSLSALTVHDLETLADGLHFALLMPRPPTTQRSLTK